MRARELRWLFIAALATLLIIAFVAGAQTIGAFAEWDNGHYRFAGGTAPSSLAYAAVVVVLYVLLLCSPRCEQGQPLPGVFRRFVAFWLDFIFGMSAVAPIVGILPMILEWRRTGTFAWNFARTTPALSDTWSVAAGLVLTVTALVFYYALPLVRARPSPGACVAGYLVVPENGTTLTLGTALLRTVVGFIAVCGACLAPFVGRDRKNGKLWVDKIFGTRAVALR